MVLHLTDDEFFALTPRQFHLLRDQHIEHRSWVELQTGSIASAIINNGFYRPKNLVSATDWITSGKFDKKQTSTKTRAKRINRKQIAATVKNFLFDQMRKQAAAKNGN